jgi:hypothetical protein
LQTELVAKVVKYNRNFVGRGGGGLIVYRAENASSERVARQLASLLGGAEKIGGLPHNEALFSFVSTEKLIAEINTKHATMVYFAPGFEDSAVEIAAAMAGVTSVVSSATSIMRCCIAALARAGRRKRATGSNHPRLDASVVVRY